MKKKNLKFILILGLGLILVSPYVLTRETFLSSGFSDTGEIGDTIGGLTAPIIGIFSIYFIYLALIAQVASNDTAQILQLFEHTKDSIDNLVSPTLDNSGNEIKRVQGPQAIHDVIQRKGIDYYVNDYPEANHTITDLSLIGDMFTAMLKKIEHSSLTIEEQGIYHSLIFSLYYSKLAFALNSLVNKCVLSNISNGLVDKLSQFRETMNDLDVSINKREKLTPQEYMERYAQNKTKDATSK